MSAATPSRKDKEPSDTHKLNQKREVTPLQNTLFVVGAILFIFAVAIVLLLYLVLKVTDDEDEHKVVLAEFNIITNIFLVWPGTLALLRGGWLEATVLFVATLVSVMHHACTHTGTPFEANFPRLVDEQQATFVFTSVVAAAASLYVLFGQKKRNVYAAVTFLVIAVAVFAATFAAKPDLPCLGGNDPLWNIADVVTAMSVAILFGLYVLRLHFEAKETYFIHSNDVVALFYIGIVLTVIFKLYEVETEAHFAILLIILASLFVVLTIVRCTVVSFSDLRSQFCGSLRKAWFDVFAFLTLALIAVTIFVWDNTPELHPIWHILAGLAVYFALDVWFSQGVLRSNLPVANDKDKKNTRGTDDTNPLLAARTNLVNLIESSHPSAYQTWQRLQTQFPVGGHTATDALLRQRSTSHSLHT